MKYKLVLVEGIDGSGKGVITDTFKELAERDGLKVFDLRNYLKSGKDFPEYEDIKGYDVIVSAEPTFGWIGRAIREELIKDNGRKYPAITVAQAYSLDRHILYKRILVQALKDGKIVLQERGVVSSLAYQPLQAQTQGEELELNQVLDLPGNKMAVQDIPPTVLLITKVDPEKVIERLDLRQKKDVCIFEKLDFQKRLQERYESTWMRLLFEKQGTYVVYLDTNNTLEDTKKEAEKVWEKYLKQKS
ncbi:hypothetical protein FJZ53_03180 [Candidatus Woesearchaeota archaeon]|nr:hypothetical protein [Candidatus Woesearchaeota archaeon]